MFLSGRTASFNSDVFSQFQYVLVQSQLVYTKTLKGAASNIMMFVPRLPNRAEQEVAFSSHETQVYIRVLLLLNNK